jgi:hypothetical protein
MTNATGTTENERAAVAAAQSAQVAPPKQASKNRTTRKASAPTGRKPAKAVSKKATTKDAAPQKATKSVTLTALISRKGGASLEELMMALGWQKHSVRGAISVLGRTMKVRSENRDGQRVYTAKD